MNDVMKTIHNILRLKAWRVAFFSVNIDVCYLSIFYLLLVTNFSRGLGGILVLLAVIMLYQAYMYLINDFFDMPEDKIVGKKKAIYELKEWQIIALLVTLTLLNFSLVFVVIRNIVFSSIFSIAYFLATFYSAPPIKFKRKGWMGTTCDTLMEKPLPILLIFIYFNHFHFDTLLFFAVMLIVQLFSIIQHEIVDYEVDVKTNVNTLVVKIGKDRARVLNNYLFQIFFVFSFVLFGFTAIKIPIAGVIIFILLAIGLAVLHKLIKEKKISDKDLSFHIPLPAYILFFYIFLYTIITSIFGLMVIIRSFGYLSLFLLFLLSQYFDVKNYYLNFLVKVFAKQKSFF